MLRVGALALVVGPLVAACTGTSAKAAPDPLLPMMDLALRDADTATAAATAFAAAGATLTAIGTVRRQQAAALRAEVNRAAGVTASTSPTGSSTVPAPTDESTVVTGLLTDLATAGQQAAALLPSLPRYRAGLVGSVAGGCASLAEAMRGTPITSTSATSANPSPSGGAPTLGSAAPSGATLPSDTAQALQDALNAENAALWLYGTVSAFVSGGVVPEVIAGMQAVQNLRDATSTRLAAGQVPPAPAQPAYLVPTPMSDQTSALVNLAIAESDATVAWRSVLEHTDDAALRAAVLTALVDSAVRQTRWRRLAGQSPASIALPGAGS
jgi:hypothetical protein